VLFSQRSAYPLALGRTVRTAAAGAPQGFFPATEPSSVTVPKPRAFSAVDRELITLFEQTMRVRQTLTGPAAVAELSRIAEAVDQKHPNAWLLRWNLLEILTILGEQGALTAKLVAELEDLELRFDHQEPITTGLSYIRALSRGEQLHQAHAG
jgi:hypothetical protein